MAFLVPAEGWAQSTSDEVRGDASVLDRERAEYTPLGMRLGGFMLNATLDLALVSTDNVFAEEFTPVDDQIFLIAPSATLNSTWSRHALSFGAGAQSSSYQDFSNEDATTWYANTAGRLDIGANSAVRGSAAVIHGVESRTDPDAAFFGDPVDIDRTELSVGGEHRFVRFTVSGDVFRNTWDYSGGAVSQDYRDNVETGAVGRLTFDVTPRLSAIAQVRVDERDYDDPTTPDSDGVAYLAGVGINFTDLLQGEVLAGVFERDYDGGAETNGTAVSANVVWYASRLTNFTFFANRQGEDVSGTVATPYTAENYGVRVDHEFQRNVLLAGGVSAGKHNYEVLDREDRVLAGFAGVDYLVNRRVVLYGVYTYKEIDSRGADRYRDFEANTVRLGVRFHL